MSGDYPAYIDHRDEEIVKRLTEGEVYSSPQLVEAYKRYTDIRKDSTAKERKSALFNSPCMEYGGTPGYFEFIGFGHEDELL